MQGVGKLGENSKELFSLPFLFTVFPCSCVDSLQAQRTPKQVDNEVENISLDNSEWSRRLCEHYRLFFYWQLNSLFTWHFPAYHTRWLWANLNLDFFSLLLDKRKKSFFSLFTTSALSAPEKGSDFNHKYYAQQNTQSIIQSSPWRPMAMLIEHSGPLRMNFGGLKENFPPKKLFLFSLLHFSHTPEQSRGWIRNI